MEEQPQNRHGGSGNKGQVAVDTEDHPPEGKMLPVWFFVGIIFLVYGIIILVVGIQELHHPASTVLAAELHPTIWWGAILTAIGGFYVGYFGPWRL